MAATKERERDRLDELKDAFDTFIKQYEIDMRGDKDVSNGGSRGIVGEVRELKKYLKDYPSLTYMMAHSPLQTMATVLGMLLVWQLIYEFAPPLVAGLLQYLGLPIP